MPLVVREKRPRAMSFQGKEDNIAVTWRQEFFVDITPPTNPNNVTEYDILTAPGIPKVNRTVWENNGKIMPFVICRGKRANFDGRTERRVSVTADYTTPTKGAGRSLTGNSEEEENQPIDPPASVTDITPKAVVTFGGKDKVLYQDLSINVKDCARTPTGNFWNTPVMNRQGVATLKLSQYEPDLTYSAALDRMFMMNNALWQTEQPHAWLIKNVEFNIVEVLLSSGPTASPLAVYTIELDRSPGGHKERRALFDTQYLDANGDVIKFKNKEPGSQSIGYINEDGTKRVAQTGPPEYIEYQNQGEIDYDAFMQL